MDHDETQKQPRLTASMPVGTAVRYWPMTRGIGTSMLDAPRTGMIREPFSVLGGHTVVGWIDTVRGCVLASRIERAADLAAAAEEGAGP